MIRRLRWHILRRFGGLNRLLVWICVGSSLLTLYFITKLLFAPSSRQILDADGLPRNITGEKCGMVCPHNQLAFYIRTGVENKEGPIICYEGKYYFSPQLKNIHRGINAVFINFFTRNVVDTRVFDTYEEEYPLLRYMRKNVPENTIILLASYDEMSENLKEDGKQWLKLFGSGHIDDIAFRDSYLLIGQKGIKQGYAIEFLKTNGKNYAEPIEKKGCFSLPMGPESELKVEPPSIKEGQSIQLGSLLSNCGYEKQCDDTDTFSVMVNTGSKDQAVPKICVGGRMVMEEKLNDAGRGFNVVIIDTKTKTPKSVSRFDTYQQDSIGFESFLEDMSNGDIIIAVASDDASRKLSSNAKDLLNKLGSSMIQNLKFRDVWYFISQKGMKGFTLMEQISFAGYDGDWPKSLHSSFCLHKKLTGSKVAPEPQSYRNEERRAFCKKYDGYADFCDPVFVDEPLKPVGLVDRTMAKHQIYQTPIVIVPGMNHNALVRTLETTLMQPGINPESVVVAWDENFPEYAELAGVFNFKNLSIKSSVKYTDQIMKAIEISWELFSHSEHIVFIEEDISLAPDFLWFMAQCYNILYEDNTLLGISALNYNGYDTTSGDRQLVYRVEEFPGLAVMLKKSVYENLIKTNKRNCCNERAWDGWKFKEHFENGEMMIPDVSRVYRQPYQSSNFDTEHLQEMFQKPRLTNLEINVELKGLQNLTKHKYEDLLVQHIQSSQAIPIDEVTKCLQVRNYQLYIPKSNQRFSYSIFYHQDKLRDYTLLTRLCHCFGLYSVTGYPPRNLHKGLLRFYYQGHDMLLIGSLTHYFNFKPKGFNVISKSILSRR